MVWRRKISLDFSVHRPKGSIREAGKASIYTKYEFSRRYHMAFTIFERSRKGVEQIIGECTRADEPRLPLGNIQLVSLD